MKTFSKTLIAAAAFAAIATTAFSQVPWEFNPGMAYMYAGPGKMSAMAMAATPRNHDAMMKNAKKVPSNTVFFMDKGQLYSASACSTRPAISICPEPFGAEAFGSPLRGGPDRKIITICRSPP